MVIYHVAKSWDGGDLLSLRRRGEWSDDVEADILERWPDVNPWVYYNTAGRYVHCHGTLAEAVNYRDEWCEGGTILAIDASGYVVEEDEEYPHPVIRDEVSASDVRPVLTADNWHLEVS